MPFGRGRSEDELPTVEGEGEREVAAPEISERPESTPGRSQRVRPSVVGCGLALGSLALLLVPLAIRVRRLGPLPAAPDTLAVSAVASAIVQGEQVSDGRSGNTTANPASTATAPPVVPPSPAAQPANLWAAEIPEAACIPSDLPQTGRVVDIVDGNAIRVLLDRDGRVYSVRLLGANAPALDGATAGLGLEARVRSSELVYRKQVILVRDLTDTDASGTLLRYVLAGGVFVNHAMIQEGLAKLEMSEPDTACLDTFLAAQHEAQANALGIWGAGSMPTTMP